MFESFIYLLFDHVICFQIQKQISENDLKSMMLRLKDSFKITQIDKNIEENTNNNLKNYYKT